MNLDTRTLLFVMWLNVTMMSVVLFVGVGRSSRSGLRAWNAALLIQMVAWALFIAGMEPIRPSLIIVSVGLLSASLTAMYVTVQRFLHLPIQQIYVWGAPPLVAWTHALVFDDFALRVAHINLILCAQMLWFAWLLLRKNELQTTGCRWRWLGGLSFCLSGLFVLGRACLVLFAPEKFPRFDQDHWLHVLGLLVNNVSLTIGTLAFLLAHRDEAEQELQLLATTDPLTGLHNRRWLEERGEDHIRLAKRYGHPLSVMLIDLDHFKQINDTHGHATGDLVLQRFAEALQSVARDADLVARYGGEEFAVLLPMSSLPSAMELDQRLRQALAKTMSAEFGWPVTYSAGCAALGDDADGLQALYARADALLYQAKRNGRNRTEINV